MCEWFYINLLHFSLNFNCLSKESNNGFEEVRDLNDSNAALHILVDTISELNRVAGMSDHESKRISLAHLCE